MKSSDVFIEVAENSLKINRSSI